MFQAKCIEKIRDKNNLIVAYKLQDTQGNIKTVSPRQLKQSIKTNQIDIINLKLTSNNRLIDKIMSFKESIKPNKTSITLEREYITPLNNKNNKSLSFKIKENLSNLLKKSQLLGYPIQKLEDNLYLLESSTQIIVTTDLDKLYLPDDCLCLFGGSLLKSINFKNIDTSKVTDMAYMFYSCKAQQLNLSSFNTQNVTDMDCMFNSCQTQQLDLSSFNTQKVTNMHKMFSQCQAKQLDLSSFNTQNVDIMSRMLSDCQAQKIIVNREGMQNILSNKETFKGCNAQIEVKE